VESSRQPLSIENVAQELAQPLLRYLERYAGDRAVAEDLRQETLIRMARGLSSFEGRSSIKTWAFSIATRVAADHFRHPDRRACIVDLDEADELQDSGPAMDDRLVFQEMDGCIRRVIDSLPDPYRSALILHDLEGLTSEQAAEICGCSIASVKIRVHRARLRLKKALIERCEFYRDSDGVFRCDRKKAGVAPME
jgi:RNA polymerase sigma-70 factor (ECF subfamily)